MSGEARCTEVLCIAPDSGVAGRAASCPVPSLFPASLPPCVAYLLLQLQQRLCDLLLAVPCHDPSAVILRGGTKHGGPVAVPGHSGTVLTASLLPQQQLRKLDLLDEALTSGTSFARASIGAAMAGPGAPISKTAAAARLHAAFAAAGWGLAWNAGLLVLTCSADPASAATGFKGRAVQQGTETWHDVQRACRAPRNGRVMTVLNAQGKTCTDEEYGNSVDCCTSGIDACMLCWLPHSSKPTCDTLDAVLHAQLEHRAQL